MTYFEDYLAERLKEPGVRAGYEAAMDEPALRLDASTIARLYHVPEFMLTGVHRLARPRRRIPLRVHHRP